MMQKMRGSWVHACVHILAAEALCSVAVKNSVVVKRAGPRADGSGSYSRSTAFRACGFGQVA